jgi:hypothetical protein
VGEDEVRAREAIKAAFVDPEYSVLGLKRGLGRDEIQYLDVVTGWRGTFWVWPAGTRRSRSQ